MTTVLHLIDTGGPGGAETVYLHVATGIDPAIFRPVCVMSRDDWLASELRQRGVTPHIMCSSGSFNVGYLRSLVRLVSAEKVQLIVAHLYGSAIYGSIVSMLTGVPVVAVLHGQSDILNSGRLSSIKRFLVRRRPRYLAFVSARLRDELAGALGTDPARCVVIPNGVDRARFSGGPDAGLRRALGLPQDAIVVGAVGNIRAPKAYPVLLRAARRLVDRTARYHIVIAGEGSGRLMAELEQLRDSLALDGHVHFLGLRRDVAQVLRGFDVYALSSVTEGFSIACVEAMAAGVPVVATRSGGPEEIVEHGRSGLLVPTGDDAALAAAIHDVASDHNLADRLAKGAQVRVAERFTLEAMLKSYAELFSRVAHGHDGATER